MRASDNPADQASYARELLRKLWTTKGVRFESSRRLEKTHAASGLTTSILSVYVIAVTVIELLSRCTSEPGAGVTDTSAARYLFPLVGIVAPIFILVLEAHEGGKQYLVKAERMHRSAHRIQDLHAKLQLLVSTGEANEEKLRGFNAEYQEILRDFSAQHDNIDYFYFQALYPGEFNPQNVLELIWMKVKGRALHYLKVGAMPAALVLTPGTLLAFAIHSLVTSSS